MSDKKNIERLFQEKFKDFEAVPSQRVWNNIEAELHKKKKRRVIPIWFRLSGVAALLLVGALIGYGIWNDSPDNNGAGGVVNQEKNDLKEDNGKGLIPTKNPIKGNEAVTDVRSKNQSDDSNQENAEANSVSSEENKLQENNLKNNSIANQENSEATVDSDLNRKNAVRTSSSLKNHKNKNTAVASSLNKTAKRKGNTITKFASENTSIAKSEEKEKGNQNNKSQILNNATVKNDGLAIQENLKSSGNNNKISTLENRNNSQNNNSVPENKIAIEKELNKNNTQIAFDTKAIEEQKKDSTAVATVVPNPLEELLLQQEKEKQAVTETKVNRWQITSNVAPIYFSSASNGSPISQEFADNSKDYEKNMSYGVGINYALSNKWSVRGGVNKLTLGYNTNDIVYYAGLEGETRGANTYSAKGSPIIIEDNTAANTIVSFDNIPGKRPGHLNQTMGYIEVPVELSYKLLDRKFGIELIGGMSTMFLNENNLSVVSDGMSASVGKAQNLNDVSFTSNIGLGFKYKFWKSFQANVEPKFKYQMNTFSENDGGFKPYFIGIYSGLSFSF